MLAYTFGNRLAEQPPVQYQLSQEPASLSGSHLSSLISFAYIIQFPFATLVFLATYDRNHVASFTLESDNYTFPAWITDLK